MNRIAGASASDAVAGVDIRNAIANGNHHSGAAVAHRLRLVQARPHSLYR